MFYHYYILALVELYVNTYICQKLGFSYNSNRRIKTKMHQNSLANLNKWQKGTSGNPTGRKEGSKNIATIVRELLDDEIDPRFPLDNNLKQLMTDNGSTYATAIVYALAIKATQGDVKACNSLIELQMTSTIQDDKGACFKLASYKRLRSDLLQIENLQISNITS